jgi:predicted TIM-barrel fold metal-dependent hydrolase
MEHYTSKKCRLSFILLILLVAGCSQTRNPESAQVADTTQYYSLDDFQRVGKVNTHFHITREDTSHILLARANGFRLINVNVNTADFIPIEEQRKVAVKLIHAFPDDLVWATTFTVTGFNDTGWEKKTLDYLRSSFAQGAIAVKIWKDVGLELRDSKGNFIQIDDEKFDPILDFIEQQDKTLIGHIGEPRNAWLPIEKMTVDGDKKYFAAHPEYHMYLHPEYPSHETIINARDHMLEKHPNLRFVGAHLGSLEWDVDELARRLDKYPNMAVDMAERISHFQYQAVTDWQKVHDFFIKYQDRLIYGTDEGVYDDRPVEEVNKAAYANWLRHWKFFVSGETMKVPKVENEFRGLRLPRTVVDKIYCKNAEKWFPALSK